MNCHFAQKGISGTSVALTMLDAKGTQTLLDGKKIELYALTGDGDAKSFQFSLAPEH